LGPYLDAHAIGNRSFFHSDQLGRDWTTGKKSQRAGICDHYPLELVEQDCFVNIVCEDVLMLMSTMGDVVNAASFEIS